MSFLIEYKFHYKRTTLRTFFSNGTQQNSSRNTFHVDNFCKNWVDSYRRLPFATNRAGHVCLITQAIIRYAKSNKYADFVLIKFITYIPMPLDACPRKFKVVNYSNKHWH